MLTSPGTPPGRLKVLRAAYAGAVRDPNLIDEARTEQMDMEYTPGEDLQNLMKDIMDQLRELIERVKKILSD